MPSHSETQYSPYSAQQLFDLVADIERYPEFLPWCRAARILSCEKGSLRAELVISFKHMRESYISKVTLNPPAGASGSADIAVVMEQGPFEHLTNDWRFTPQPQGGTQIDFALDFKFRSKLLETLVGPLFSLATAKMVGAFRQRADALYRNPAA